MGPLANLLGQFSEPGTQLPGIESSPQPEPIPATPIPAPMPEEAPQVTLQDILAQNAPLLEKMREAAAKGPRKREEEIYKEKIRRMFGVKLGEKNSKWKSALRFFGEGLDSLGAGYNRTPTIRDKAAKQASEEYQQENAVLGREGMGALGNMIRGSIAQNKSGMDEKKFAFQKELAATKQAAANSTTTPKAKELLARAAKFEAEGNSAQALTELRLAQAELTQAKTGDVGMTPMLREAEAVGKDPGLYNIFANITGAKKAGEVIAGGGPQGSSVSQTREQTVTDPLTQQLVKVPITTQTSRTPTGGGKDAAREFLQGLKGGAATETPAVTGPVAPSAKGGSPSVQESVVFSKTPAPNKATVAQKQTAEAVQKFEKAPKPLGVYSPAWGKRYQLIKNATFGASGIVDSVFASAFDFDPAGKSALSKFSGPTGVLQNLFSKTSGKKPGSIVVSDEAIQTALDSYRQAITGAGASMQEIRWLTSKFPQTGKTASLEHKYTALQKSMVLHIAAQKILWNHLRASEPDEKQFQPFASAMGKRVDDVLANYKEIEKRVALAKTSAERKRLADEGRNAIQKMMNVQDLFNNVEKDVNPSAPTGQKIVYK